ncbi:MAG: hypothetical protein KF718_00855 [Polyangiaceae bacterium]|nr:hypothetical protein [Polyangiaceae bacterium]
MSESNDPPVHWLERMLDNTWLLLALGVLIPAISYTLWGLLELANLKAATLP